MKRIVFFLSILAAVACKPAIPHIGLTSTSSPASMEPYIEALEKAGVKPVALPVVSTGYEAAAAVARLDGIVFTGGEDIDPAWYGESILNETVEINAVRDHSDSLLASVAIVSGKPVLAICRGEQIMNVMLGGSLYQDIPSQLENTVEHRGNVMHKIGVEPGSILAELYGTDSLEVNSNHHQAIKDMAPGARITARSSDGIVEAFETDNIWAVQFHPEKLVRSGDDRWLALFEAFIERCK